MQILLLLGHQSIHKPTWCTVDWVSRWNEQEIWHEVKFRKSGFRSLGLNPSQIRRFLKAGEHSFWIWQIVPGKHSMITKVISCNLWENPGKLVQW